MRQALIASIIILLFGILPMSLLYGLHSALTPIKDVQVLEVVAAEVDAPTGAAWQNLTLPNKLCRFDCTTHHKRYRTVQTLDEQSALYIPLFDSAVTVTVDGERIATFGRTTKPISDLSYRPILVALPRDRGATATLDITVSSVTAQGGRLAPFYVADIGSLTGAFNAAHILSVDATESIALVLVIAGLLALALLASGERDRAYAWFALLCAAAVLRALGTIVPYWPEDYVIRHALYLIATASVLCASLGFVIALTRPHCSRTEYVLGSALPVFCIACVWLLRQDLYQTWVSLNLVVQLAGLVVIPLVLWQMLRATRDYLPVLQGAILGALGVTAAFVLHDIYFVRTTPPLVFQLSNLAGLAFVLAFLLTLVARFVNLRQQEQSARRRLAEERARLLADMHDTVAGRLAVLAQQADSGPQRDQLLAEGLRASLRDLRAAMDSLDPMLNTDLGKALAKLRNVNAPLFARAGVQLEWDVPDVRMIHEAETVLHVVRIVQEALTNALRHAEPGTVSLTVSMDKRALDITIEDDGMGLSHAAPPGRGLNIQRQRATAAGIALTIAAAIPHGTRISLCVPTPPIRGDSIAPAPA
ncbi:MAG: ATP-binding protein [Pseudomonadota bacterium]